MEFTKALVHWVSQGVSWFSLGILILFWKYFEMLTSLNEMIKICCDVFTLSFSFFVMEIFAQTCHQPARKVSVVEKKAKQSYGGIFFSTFINTINGIFYKNCPVLRGQMNVSFRKADSLLFSLLVCGTDSSSTWAWTNRPFRQSSKGLQDCPPVASLVSEEALNADSTPDRLLFCEHPLRLLYQPCLTRTTYRKTVLS